MRSSRAFCKVRFSTGCVCVTCKIIGESCWFQKTRFVSWCRRRDLGRAWARGHPALPPVDPASPCPMTARGSQLSARRWTEQDSVPRGALMVGPPRALRVLCTGRGRDSSGHSFTQSFVHSRKIRASSALFGALAARRLLPSGLCGADRGRGSPPVTAEEPAVPRASPLPGAARPDRGRLWPVYLLISPSAL